MTHASASESSPERALLFAALRAGDAARADALLLQHPGLRDALDAPGPELPFGTLPLFPAAERGRRDLVDVLLRHGASLDAKSDWWAGGFGVLEVCDPAFAPWLIERGATVDAHAAARLGMLDRLRALLDADPSLVRARGGDGQTPLHYAATPEIAALLLDRGADIDALDVDHEGTPAQWMVQDRPEVARFLVGRGCRTDMLLVAAIGDLDRVRAHLERDPGALRLRVGDAAFPMKDRRAGGHIYIWSIGRHRTAHRVARERGHDAVARLLEDAAPPALRLAFACEAGDEAAARALAAEHPGAARTLGREELAAFPAAAEDGNRAAVRSMLTAGYPLDARGRFGETPLHWAAWNGDAAMAREILAHSPPLDDRANQWRMTPVEWAQHGSEHGPRKSTGDFGATVEALLDAGAARPEDDGGSDAVREALRRHRGAP